jgi:hypothetical protein
MANINSTSLRNNLVQSLTMSGNLTWAKADFKGKFTVFISTNNTTTRVLTISDTDFVAGDFICLLINQNSSGDVSVTIGTRSITANRGNIINALFDGTNWNVWSGGGVFNTSSSGFTRTSFGLASKASSNGATSYGYDSQATGTTSGAWGNNSTASASNAMAFGDGSVASASNASAWGVSTTSSASGATSLGTSASHTGASGTALGFASINTGAESTNVGRSTNDNAFVRSNHLGAYAYGRRYGSTRFHLGTTTSTSDATNPTQNKEWATWNGITTNNTITEIFLRGVSSNRCVLQAKNVLKFRGQCTAFRSDYSGSAGWDITGLIKRDGSNVTTLIGVTATLTHSDGTGGTLVLTIDADDTNESLRVQVTGNASETWTWLVELELLDLRIA